jgi:hypothetical protein
VATSLASSWRALARTRRATFSRIVLALPENLRQPTAALETAWSAALGLRAPNFPLSGGKTGAQAVGLFLFTALCFLSIAPA